MITYKHPVTIEVCDIYEQPATLELIDHQMRYGLDNEYSIWELKASSEERFIEPMPFKSISIRKYIDVFDVLKLVNFLRDPEEAFMEACEEESEINFDGHIYASSTIDLRRIQVASGTIYDYTFYSEYHSVYFAINSAQLTNCFPEILARKAINAL